MKIVAQNSGKCGIRNVFSFGDSQIERKALFTASKYFLFVTRCRAIETKLLSKSVKFMESADLQALKRQISLIRYNLESLITHPDDIDMVFTLGAA